MSKAPPFRITIDLENSMLFLEVHGTATPYDPGVTSGPPESCYPPEGGEVEIEEVWLHCESGQTAEITPLITLFGDEAWDKIQQLTERAIANLLPPEPDYPEPEDTFL